MEFMVANFQAVSPRRVREGDRDYLVAPLTLIVPGILNGSKGPLFYSPEETKRTAEAWNGMPITLRHPRKNGSLVSAKDGGTRLGEVRNPRFDDKLIAEGWFDVAELAKQDPWLFRAVSNGTKVELSTGLYTKDTPVKNGEHNGQAYTHVVTILKPDHLAVLPDETGACSIDDGCGVNVNAASASIVRKLSDLYRQTADAIGELFGLNFDRDNVAGNAQPHSKNTGRFKRLGAGTGRGDIHARAQGGFANAAITPRQRELGADAKAQAEAGSNPPSWVGDELTWERAKEAAEKSGGGDNPYALITYIYENMGGTIISGNALNPEEEEATMPLKKEERKTLIDNLLGCCWEENDRETLDGLTDNQLVRLDKQAKESAALTLVANAARDTFKLPKDMAINEMPEALKKAMAAKAGDEDEDEEEDKKVKTENKRAIPAKPPTADEWLKHAPAEVQEDLAFARNEKARQKAEIVGKLTANIEGEAKTRAQQRLQALPLDQLRDLIPLVPEPKQRVTANYGTIAAVDNQEKVEPLGLPTWDFSPAK